MIDPLAIQRDDALADSLPRYDEAFVRLNAGLSDEQTGGKAGGLGPYLEKAVEAFEVDTSLKIYRHAFSYDIDGRVLHVDQERSILLPGLACEVTAFTCDGETVPATSYKTLTHNQTGCKILKPNRYWSVDRDSTLNVKFTAGIAATDTIPAGIQSILAVRIRFDTYSGSGDLLRYNEERRRYTVGTIVFQ